MVLKYLFLFIQLNVLENPEKLAHCKKKSLLMMELMDFYSVFSEVKIKEKDNNTMPLFFHNF